MDIDDAASSDMRDSTLKISIVVSMPTPSIIFSVVSLIVVMRSRVLGLRCAVLCYVVLYYTEL